jgi:Protein of unknown function (DUF3997)
MRWFRAISVCGFVAIVLGCGGIGGRVHEQKLVGDIELRAVDRWEEMELVDADRGRELVPATVYAIGWNESHLVAKRHPPSPTGRPNDKTQTEYYIVVVRNRKVYGPFDRDEFRMHRDFLDVADGLDFTLTFRELE